MSVSHRYDLNGSGGAFVSIPATIPCRMVEIREDESVTSVGLQYELPDDGFTQVYVIGVVGSDDQPQIVLGDKVAIQHGRGRILGWPAQTLGGNGPNNNPTGAATLIKLKSATAATTKIRVTEYE